MNLLKGSGVLKIAALLVALLTYFYIHNEIYNIERKNAADPSYKLIKLTAKSLPIHARMESGPPEGYRLSDPVRVSPARVIVIAPEALLEDAWTAETAIVDIAENTKTAERKIPLESVAGIHMTGEPFVVNVTIPIEKIPTLDKIEPAAEQPAASEAPAQA